MNGWNQRFYIIFGQFYSMARLLILLICLLSGAVMAQEETPQNPPIEDPQEVQYEVLYDAPSNIKRLFIGVMPLYGELFATNVNIGFALEAHYFHKNKADFKLQIRKPYTSTFTDFNFLNAKNAGALKNEPVPFFYAEGGLNWHVKDFEVDSKTKVVLYKSTLKGNAWGAKVASHTMVPCKVRRVFGARVGALFWKGTVDVSKALELDGKSNGDLGQLPETYIDDNGKTKALNLFTGIRSAGLYAGGSMTWIRNIGLDLEDFESTADDGILTFFADIMYAPYIKMDNLLYQGNDYHPGILLIKSFGARMGIDGKFNRTFSWGYGAEVGVRPSVSHLRFYAAIKFAFPIYGTDLKTRVEGVPKQ